MGYESGMKNKHDQRYGYQEVIKFQDRVGDVTIHETWPMTSQRNTHKRPQMEIRIYDYVAWRRCLWRKGLNSEWWRWTVEIVR